MLTLGVDLAAQASNTAFCFIEWRNGAAIVQDAGRGAGDDDLLEYVFRADKAGIDVPFGWPAAFVDAIAAHELDKPWPERDRLDLRFRATDRHVKERIGRWPLSVSSDLIAVPAMRAAALLWRLAEHGDPVDRSGLGKVVEAYPAGALAVWGFKSTGYKRVKGTDSRRALLSCFEVRTRRWLRLTAGVRTACQRSDDVIDALVASLVARAAALDLCEPIPEGDRRLARQEGWIALPERDSLDKLA